MTRLTRTLAGTLLASTVGAAAGVAVLAAPSYAGSIVSVAAQDNTFDPKTTEVRVGDTVRWANHGNSPHNVTAVDGSFESGNMDSGKTYSRAFSTAGTVRYYCSYHGTKEGTGMYGTLTVRAATTGDTTGTGSPGTGTSHPRTGGGREVPVGVAVLALSGAVALALTSSRRRVA
jgi:plastocyanin